MMTFQNDKQCLIIRKKIELIVECSSGEQVKKFRLIFIIINNQNFKLTWAAKVRYN